MKKLCFLPVLFLLIIVSQLSAQNGQTCATAFPIGSLPFTMTNLTTEGSGNDYDDTHACNSTYMTTDDFVFVYTPSQNQTVRVSLTNTGNAVGLFLVDGCPDDPGAICLGVAEAIMGDPAIDGVILTGGTDYYIIISTWDPIGFTPTTTFDIEVAEIVPDDGGVSQILTPVSGYNLTATEAVTVVIENYGVNILTNFDVAFELTGSPAQTETVLDTVFPGAALTYMFASTLDLSAPGVYEISAYTIIASDTIAYNDIATTTVENMIPPPGAICSSALTVTSLPYYQTDLTTEGFGNEYGASDACNGANISGNDFVFEYTPASTQHINIYLSDAFGTLNLLLGQMGRVGLYITEGCMDDPTAVCIASAEDQTGNPTLNAVPLTGGTTYYITISTNDLFGQNSSTDFSIEITEALQLDGGIIEIISPVTNYELTASENVTVIIKNFGIDTLTNFDIQYQLSGSAEEIVTITDTIIPGGELTYTFPLTLDLSAPGMSWYLSSGTLITGDLDATNDIMYAQITNMIIPTGSRCDDPYVINDLPFVQTNMTTATMTNEYGQGDACGSLNMTGNDYVFTYTPAQNEDVRIRLTNALGTFSMLTSDYLGMVGLFVTDLCPDDTLANCVASDEQQAGNPSIDIVSLTAGTTYYIIVSTNEALGQNSSTQFDIEIRTIEQFDAGVIAITEPVSGPALTANEQVTVLIYNSGADPIIDFNVAYTIDNGTPVIEMISSEILSEDTLIYTFSATADLSEVGKNFSIVAYTMLFTDNNTSNDSTQADVFHEGPPGWSCVDPKVITAIPYEQTGLTTLGYVNTYSSDDACGSTFLNQNDHVFSYMTTVGQNLDIILSNTTTNVGLFLFKNCPDDVNAECIAYTESTAANPSLLNQGFTQWTNYYIVVSSDTNAQTDFDIKVDIAGSGIDELDASKIKIWPNPATSKVSIDPGDNLNDYTLNLIDITGRLITNMEFRGTAELSLSDISKGVYLLQIVNGQKVYQQKLVVE